MDRAKVIEWFKNRAENTPMPGAKAMYQSAYKLLCEQEQSKWISVKERLPEEKDGIFAHLYGTKQWQPGIHRRCSKAVIGCVKLEDGSRFTTALCTFDGEWDWHKLHGGKVTHWMPLPEPPKEGVEG